MTESTHLLAIAKKAGLLEIGADSVRQAAERGRARLILTAADASDRSVRGARAAAEAADVPCIRLPDTMAELGSLVGRGTPGILAVTDTGLASAFLKRLNAELPDRYAGEAALLEKLAGRAARRKRAAGGQRKGRSDAGEKGRNEV